MRTKKTKQKLIRNPKKNALKKGAKQPSKKPVHAKTFAATLGTDEPDCLSMDDAIAAVRACAKKVNPSTGDNIKMNTQLSLLFPGDQDQIACKRFLACIEKNTGFDLDPDNFCDGTLGDVAKALTCDGDAE